MNKKIWLVLFLLTLLLVAVRLPSFDEPLDNDSGANAFFARQMLRGETLYDRFHPTHHLPGVYYTYLAAFKLFGDRDIAPKLFLLPWALACAWLIYDLGRTIADERTGLLGAVFFILVSSQVSLKGTTVEMEHFANLPLTAGVLLCMVLIRNRAPAWQFIGVGFLGAVGVLYKIIFVGPLVVAGIIIPAAAWLDGGDRQSCKTALLRLTWTFVGLVIPVMSVAAYFASLGLWDRILLIFQLGFGYMKDSGMLDWLPPPFGFPLFWMSASNSALLIFGLFGVYRHARRVFPFRSMDNLMHLAVMSWVTISFVEAGMRRGGWEHYALLVVPPLALMAASEIGTAYQRWNVPHRQAMIRTAAMASLVILNFGFMNFDFYSHHIQYKLGLISYKDFIYGYAGTSGSGPDIYHSESIGYYIKAHTTPEDLIYLASNNMQTYYYADRRPPIDIIWPGYIFVGGPAERIFDPRTTYIVVDRPEKIDRPQWLVEGLSSFYRLEIVLGQQEIYRRRTP